MSEYLKLLGMFLALYVAWGIGSNDETMSPVVGSRFLGLSALTVIGGIFAYLGAALLGQHVETTIGRELLLGSVTMYETLIIVFSLSTWITIASSMGLPISTTHGMVGAAVGVGLTKWGIKGIAWTRIGRIMVAWIASPLLGLASSYLVTLLTTRILRRRVKGMIGFVKLSRASAYMLFIWACFMSFIRGANDIGNATAFLSTRTIYNPLLVRSVVAAGMVLGLVVMGRRVLKVVGVELVELTPMTALVTQFCASMIMLVATLFGIPLSGSYILIGSVVGVGLAGGSYINTRRVLEISTIWLGTFAGAATISSVVMILVDLMPY